jgi:uncharacterized protein involved in response to NO
MRSWRAPAILAYGFRPLFFGAVFAEAFWLPILSGLVSLA